MGMGKPRTIEEIKKEIAKSEKIITDELNAVLAKFSEVSVKIITHKTNGIPDQAVASIKAVL